MENLQSDPNSELLQFPVKSVLIIALTAVFMSIIVGMGVTALAFQIYGVSQHTFFELVGGNEAGLMDRNFLRITTLLSHAFTFLIPSVFVAWMLYKKDWVRFLQLHNAPSIIILLLTLFFILSAMPLVQFSIWVNQLIPLPAWASTLESETEGIIKTFLTMENGGELILSFIVMALVPAIGEELLFRGIIQRTLAQIIKNQHIAVWIAAFIFSFFHFQFAGFLPRMLLGGLLGYLLVWTKNLWFPIFAHLIFNGTQVVATYLYKEKLEEINLESAEMPAVGLIIISLILVPAFGIAIQRLQKQINYQP